MNNNDDRERQADSLSPPLASSSAFPSASAAAMSLRLTQRWRSTIPRLRPSNWVERGRTRDWRASGRGREMEIRREAGRPSSRFLQQASRRQPPGCWEAPTGPRKRRLAAVREATACSRPRTGRRAGSGRRSAQPPPTPKCGGNFSPLEEGSVRLWRRRCVLGAYRNLVRACPGSSLSGGNADEWARRARRTAARGRGPARCSSRGADSTGLGAD